MRHAVPDKVGPSNIILPKILTREAQNFSQKILSARGTRRVSASKIDSDTG